MFNDKLFFRGRAKHNLMENYMTQKVQASKVIFSFEKIKITAVKVWCHVNQNVGRY
jgi:hypothetical protein